MGKTQSMYMKNWSVVFVGMDHSFPQKPKRLLQTNKTLTGCTMGLVGFTMGYLAQGLGLMKKTTDRVRLSSVFSLLPRSISISPHSIHYSVVFMPNGTACCGAKVHLRPPTYTKITPLHLHTCIWSSREIPVGKEGARSVVHLYQSAVLTFKETDRF